MGFFWDFLTSQLFVTLPYPTCSFEGQTIVITGSNTGLGLEAARHIVRLGADKVILAVRNIQKGEAAAEDILRSTKAKANVIEVWPLDLSDHDSIKIFASRLTTLERLDGFVQNAGVLSKSFRKSEKSGFETHIDINSVSSILLGLLALPKLKETSRKFHVRTRLCFVGSELHTIAELKEGHKAGKLMDLLSDEKISNMNDRYKTSKLLLFFAMQEIASRTPRDSETDVVICDITPGACKSDLFRDDMGWFRETVQAILVFLIARSTEAGSRTLVHGVNPQIEPEAHGRFLMNCKPAANGASADSDFGQEQKKRWISELFPKLEHIVPGVTKVLQ